MRRKRTDRDPLEEPVEQRRASFQAAASLDPRPRARPTPGRSLDAAVVHNAAHDAVHPTPSQTPHAAALRGGATRAARVGDRSACCSATASPATPSRCGRGVSTSPSGGTPSRYPCCPATAPRGRTPTPRRWTDWYGELTAHLRPAPRAGRRGRASAGCRWARARAAVGGRPRRPGRRDRCSSTRRSPASARTCWRCPVLKHVVGGFPAIGNDIKKPGGDEYAYPKTPLKALHTFVQQWKPLIADLPQDHAAAADVPLGRGPRGRPILRARSSRAGSPAAT